MAFVLADSGRDIARTGGEQRPLHIVRGHHQPAGLVDVRLALFHDRQALGRIGDDLERELHADLIPGRLQELAEELPIRALLTHPLQLDGQL